VKEVTLLVKVASFYLKDIFILGFVRIFYKRHINKDVRLIYTGYRSALRLKFAIILDRVLLSI